MRRVLCCLILLSVLLTANACSWIKHDRMYVTPAKYDQAQAIYEQTGSLALTRDTLLENPSWRRGEVNEAVYRLRKGHRLEDE